MTDLSPQTQKVVNAFNSGFEHLPAIHLKPRLALALREVVKQHSYTHLYLDGDHGIGVVNVRDILKICEELEQV